jgi:hypothetical protein
MFGPAIMVCPITSTETAPSRPVYLPGVTWYDFWTGAALTGTAGRMVTAQTPMETIPIYIRAGSIVPMGPEISYADTTADPIELRVYTGANGDFTLYEDEGDGYAYENGAYATIPISWDDAGQNLTIGERQGLFPGMQATRTFNVVFVSSKANHGAGGTVVPLAEIDKTISYTGGALVLNKTSGQIGVLPSNARPSNISFKDHLQGGKYSVATTGGKSWQVTLINAAGRVMAAKNIQGGTSSLIADRLSSGVYFVQVMCGNVLVKRKALIIHN